MSDRALQLAANESIRWDVNGCGMPAAAAAAAAAGKLHGPLVSWLRVTPSTRHDISARRQGCPIFGVEKPPTNMRKVAQIRLAQCYKKAASRSSSPVVLY